MRQEDRNKGRLMRRDAQREMAMETEGKAGSKAMRRVRKQQGKEQRKEEKARRSTERQRVQEGETDGGAHVRQNAQLGTRARVQAWGSRSRPLTGGCPIAAQQGPPASPAESEVRLFAISWAVALQALLSMEFPRQEYWSGLLFPSPGHRPNPAIKPKSLALQVDSLPSEPLGKPEAGTYPLYLKVRKKASAAAAEWARGRVLGGEG